MANPNQKIITIRREPKKESGYTYFNLDSLDEARANLRPGAFVMWTYLAQNADGWREELSNTAFCGSSTMKRAAYDSAVAELIEKGYLVLVKGKCIYEFIEKPKTKSGPVALKSNNENPLLENNTTKCLKIIQRNAQKSDNEMLENPTRNIIKHDNNTINIIQQNLLEVEESQQEEEEKEPDVWEWEALCRSLGIRNVSVHPKQLPYTLVSEGVIEVDMKGTKYKVYVP